MEGITEALSRKFRQRGVITHAVPHNTIRRQLGTPKDKDPLGELCGTVYHLKCADCEHQYVGETERALKKRVQEHKRESSPVGHHLNWNSHHLSEEKVLDRDSRWFQRGVREAIHIRSLSPTLNQDQGRHHLPRTYNPLLLTRNSSRLPAHSNVSTTNSEISAGLANASQ